MDLVDDDGTGRRVRNRLLTVLGVLGFYGGLTYLGSRPANEPLERINRTVETIQQNDFCYRDGAELECGGLVDTLGQAVEEYAAENGYNVRSEPKVLDGSTLSATVRDYNPFDGYGNPKTDALDEHLAAVSEMAFALRNFELVDQGRGRDEYRFTGDIASQEELDKRDIYDRFQKADVTDAYSHVTVEGNTVIAGNSHTNLPE